MRSLLLLFIFFGLLQNSFGQLTGKFVTEKDQPIPFATILLLNPADSSLVKGSLTSEKGDFKIENIPAGKYILRFTGVGFQTWKSQIFNIETTLNLGTLII